jgi:hypothetical protein
MFPNPTIEWRHTRRTYALNMAISTCRTYVTNFGPFFSQKVLLDSSQPSFSLSPNGKNLPPKEMKGKKKKKTIIPTIGFGKI